MTVCACLLSATVSPLEKPRGRLRTVSAQANFVGPSTAPVYESLTPRQAAGPDAHSVGQGLTVTAAPTPDPCTLTHLQRVRLAFSGQAARVGCWTSRGGRHTDLDTCATDF